MKYIDLLIFLRSIQKKPVENLIKLFGLSLAFIALILIYLFIVYELSFDRFHPGADHIYRLEMAFDARGNHVQSALTAPLAGKTVLDEIAGIEAMTRIFTYSWKEEALIQYKDKEFYESKMLLVEPSFLKLFPFQILRGDEKTIFKEPNAIVISQRTAKKYFGDEDPIGKIINLKNFGDIELVVTGVIENTPPNSHFSYDLLLPLESGKDIYWEPFLGTWRNRSFYTYIMINEKVDIHIVENEINKLITQKQPDARVKADYSLKPLSKIHLSSHLSDELQPNGSMTHLLFAFAIALVICIITISNYSSISMAQIFFRAREVGIKKLFGINGIRLGFQLIIESGFFTIAATLIALLCIELFSNPIISYLKIDTGMLKNYLRFLPGIFIFTLTIGLIAGLFPAFLYASYQAIDILKGRFWNLQGKLIIRKLITGFQFVLVSALLAGTFMVHRQFEYLMQDEENMNIKNAIIIPLKDHSSVQGYEAYKTALAAFPEIKTVSGSSSIPFDAREKINTICQGHDDEVRMTSLNVDFNFIKAYELQLVEGRSFNNEYGKDDQTSYIVNETAARSLGWEKAVGKSIQYSNKGLRVKEFQKGQVIGVVKDFFHASKHSDIEPLIMKVDHRLNYITVCYAEGKYQEAIQRIREQWEFIYGRSDISCFKASSKMVEIYKDEKRMDKVIRSSTILAVIIAMVSILSMVKLDMKKRYKEIGIRKVFGAEKHGLSFHFLKQYMLIVIIAYLMSIPFTLTLMREWLSGFAYSAGIRPQCFILSFLTIALVIFITVVGEVWRASGMKVIDVLKFE